jgi:hypothetical protein
VTAPGGGSIARPLIGDRKRGAHLAAVPDSKTTGVVVSAAAAVDRRLLQVAVIEPQAGAVATSNWGPASAGVYSSEISLPAHQQRALPARAHCPASTTICENWRAGAAGFQGTDRAR